MNFSTKTSVLALLAGLVGVAPALAANGAKTDSSTLEELVVTARKRAENVQRAPLSITAISGVNLSKDRVLNLQDLGHNITGISFSASTPQSNEINIRGVLNTRLSSPTADQSVSIDSNNYTWESISHQHYPR